MQEKPEDVPTGELPRTVMLVVDRHNCNLVTPGTRVTVTGIYSTFKVRCCTRRAASARVDAGGGRAQLRTSMKSGDAGARGSSP